MTDGGLGPYVDALDDAFQDAWQRLDGGTRDVLLAGRHVRMRVAGDALATRLLPAFDHLPIAPEHSQPSLTIHGWDRVSAGRAAPAPPWGTDDYAPLQRVSGLDHRQVQASYDLGFGILSMRRTGAPQALLYAADAGNIPRWVARMPFRQILGWWADDEAMTFAHAAAVGRDGSCVLIAGPSGSGKSTTALACAEAGLDFLGDDLCLIDSTRCAAHAPYRWAKAESAALGLLPSLAECVVATESGQSVIIPRNLVLSARIVGVLIPTVSGAALTEAVPARASDALFAMAPSTLVEANGAGPGSLRRLAELVRSVPVARLTLGTDMAQVVDCVSTLLQRWST